MQIELEHLFGSAALFVEPKAFRAWLASAKAKASALASPAVVEEAMAAYAQRDVRPTVMGSAAIIEVNGPIVYKSSWISCFFGLASIEDLQAQFRMALTDSTIDAIVFRIDSPGGVVDMMPEFADEVFESKGRGTKRVIAVADTLVASCAYWLASQADTIYATASSQLGAIGVFCEHTEISGLLEKAGVTITLIAHGDHKVDGNPYEPLSDTARADLQASVDEIGDWFDVAVARGRKVSKATVLEQFGQGKVFRGKQAIALGLADKAGTFGQVLATLAASARRPGTVRGQAAAAVSLQAGVIPKDVSDKLAPKDTPWSALTLADFTDQAWGSLSVGEKRHIAGHFAWAASMPPETFGDLKLGHHRPSDGAVVFRGVTNALARLDQTKLPAGDASKVRAHLERHHAAFEKQDAKTGAAAAGPTVHASVDPKDPDEEMVEPVDGACPDGYELGDDGMCHLPADPEDDADPDEDDDVAQADAEAIVAALSGDKAGLQ